MKKKSAKKIVSKKKAKAPAKKKAPEKKAKAPVNWKDFSDWWDKVGMKMTDKIERRWLKENEPNDPEEDGGGDHWCVNEMMHNGDAHEMTYEIAENVFNQGKNGEKWEYNQGDSLYCELDSVIIDAYQAGQKARTV